MAENTKVLTKIERFDKKDAKNTEQNTQDFDLMFNSANHIEDYGLDSMSLTFGCGGGLAI
jgi:hypothetical protein